MTGDLTVRTDFALEHRSGNKNAIEDNGELTAAIGRILGTVSDVVARKGGEGLRACRIERKGNGEGSCHIALDMGGNKSITRQLSLTGNKVRRERAVAVLLKHELIAGIGSLKSCKTSRIALAGRNLGVVLDALVARAAGALAIALGADIAAEKLVAEIGVARMRKTELKERCGLERTLRGLASLFIDTRKLHEQTVILHSLNDRLVHAHSVDTAADDLNDTSITPLKGRLDLLLNGADFVGDRRILGDDGFAQLILINPHGERSAALEVKAEAELILHRECHIYREYRDNEK